MFEFTDGEQVITAVLFEDTHRSAHNAFNIINDVPLDEIVAPHRAIDYVMNNEQITLRNGEVVGYGEYIIKDSKGEVRRCSASDFIETYRPMD